MTGGIILTIIIMAFIIYCKKKATADELTRNK